MILRGRYSTIRAEHEDCKRSMSILCGRLQSVAAQVLKRMQPDNDEVPESVDGLLEDGRKALDNIDALALRIESLSTQRKTLKPLAWPKG